MRACNTCQLALTVKDDDGTGSHKVCPRTPDREAYLARRRERMPHLTELHEQHRRDQENERP